MPIPIYGAQDFLGAALRTLPRGRAWPRALSSTLARFLAPFMLTPARFCEAAAAFPSEVFPGTALDMLPEWEASLGLPDPCAGDTPAIAQRRAQVVARLADSGGSSVAYFVGFAANLGYDISVTEYAPSRCGIFHCGDAVQGEDWAYCWLVLHPGYTPIKFQIGSSAAGEALMSWSNGPLVWEIEARNPAHLIIRFGQNGTNLLTDWAGDIL